jgi:hypothetical protein
MIGMIRFGARGGVAEAILGDDGRWSCAAVRCLVRPLEILYSPNWEGRPAGRRHLEEAAIWLMGTVVFGADSPILGMAPRSNPGVPGHLLDRRSRPPMARRTKQSDRVTDRAAARRCRVDLGMIRLWVQTGAWPMPRRCGESPRTFALAEVEGWLATGAWPAGAQFRAPPGNGPPPTLLARDAADLPAEAFRRRRFDGNWVRSPRGPCSPSVHRTGSATQALAPPPARRRLPGGGVDPV